jgi:hypothetical protein
MRQSKFHNRDSKTSIDETTELPQIRQQISPQIRQQKSPQQGQQKTLQNEIVKPFNNKAWERRRKSWCLNTPSDQQGRGGGGADASTNSTAASKEGCDTLAQSRVNMRLS